MPEGEAEFTQSQNKTDLTPLRTPETRVLVAKRKEEDWENKQDIRGIISNRDILEFAAVRNMAGAIQEASEQLAQLPSRGGYSRERAEQIFDKIIASPDRNLSQKQIEALKRGRDTILDSIDTFNAWLDEHTEDDIYSLLGDRFAEIDRSKLQIDTTRFPGVVVVKAADTETYQAIQDKETIIGFYNKNLGEKILKGRILVINAAEAHNDTDRHEYQHFIFAQASKDIEFLPEVSKRKIKDAYKKKKEESKKRRLKAKKSYEEAKEAIKKAGANKRYKEVVPDFGQKEKEYRSLFHKKLPKANFALTSQFFTYPEGSIRDSFTKFRNEFMAYASGGGKKARFETYFGDSLDDAQKDPYFERFQAETDLVKGVLALAEKKDLPMERLGFLVGSARNMQQAAKFVYLETLLFDERRKNTDKTNSKKPTGREINTEVLSKGFDETVFTRDEFE